MSYPIYVYLSNRGALFVPAMDTGAFPSVEDAGVVTRVVRWSSQRAFGLRAPAPMMRSVAAQARGVVGAFRRGHAGALALAISDSRALVRSLFLALGGTARRARLPVPSPAPSTSWRARTGATRRDRLAAWLDVGVELHELRRDADERYVVRGRRARALADGDPVLLAHYRSILDYQGGPYEQLGELLRSGPTEGRDDLGPHARVIADVSRAAESFVTPYLGEIVGTVRPRRLLDVGCGTGVYLQAMLDAAPGATGVGIDLAADVIEDARGRIDGAGLAARATLAVGDVRTFARRPRIATTSSR